MEVQFSQRFGCSPSGQTKETPGPHTITFEAQQSLSEDHSKSGWPGYVDYSTFPLMRSWLHHLYMDMYKIPATQFSVDPGCWHEMVACLTNDLTFHSRPPGTAIPVGGKLVEGHRKVFSLDDVRSSLLSKRRVGFAFGTRHQPEEF